MRVFSRGLSHSDVYSRKIPVVSVRGSMLEGDIPVRTQNDVGKNKSVTAGRDRVDGSRVFRGMMDGERGVKGNVQACNLGSKKTVRSSSETGDT